MVTCDICKTEIRVINNIPTHFSVNKNVREMCNPCLRELRTEIVTIDNASSPDRKNKISEAVTKMKDAKKEIL